MGSAVRMSTPAHSTARPASTSTIDLLTLAITAIASAAAAYICSQIWKPGTLPSAALMPVLVALIKEALARPTHAVAHAVPVRGVVRSATRTDEPLEPVTERVAQQGEIAGPSRARRAWKTAIVTGLLGFLVGAVIITVPELVLGQPASGGGSGTTLFGGQHGAREPAAPTDTTTTTTTTPAETVTVPPAETVTVPEPSSTTTTTVPETQSTPVPRTPAPPTTTQPPPTTTTPAPVTPPQPPG